MTPYKRSIKIRSCIHNLFDMTNKHASKQHGLSNVKRMQPKSKLRNRKNKELANARKLERREILKAA